MKKVLIAGAGSYIGEQIAASLAPDRFSVETLSLRGESWKRKDFSGFDTVVQVAGVAHQQESEQNAALYFAVNRDLAVETARRAKAAGVKQFVYFSSMSVYGLVVGHITADTPVNPVTNYGKSKWEAEQALRALADDSFHVAVLRPPMIYGRGCKGNYPRLAKLILRFHVFPRVNSERSMLYIGTLCGFMARLIESGEGGLYFPQNREYVRTNELARQIALAHASALWQPRGLGWLMKPLAARGGTLGKVLGSLTYERSMSAAFAGEELDFAQTIRETEAQP